MNLKGLLRDAIYNYIEISEDQIKDAVKRVFTRGSIGERIEEAIEEKLIDYIEELIDDEIDEIIEDAVGEAIEEML